MGLKFFILRAPEWKTFSFFRLKKGFSSFVGNFKNSVIVSNGVGNSWLGR